MKSFIYKLILKFLDFMVKNLHKITPTDIEFLEKAHSKVERGLGVSENGKWCVDWRVQKFENETAQKNNIPYETVMAKQNIILDTGANTMLKLICGITGVTAFDATNAKIGVGNSATPENATQNGLLATAPNLLYKPLEATYPKVDNRTMVFKAVFDDGEANFAWNEFAIVNGLGVGGIAMNRKVQALGVKTTGIWSLQITISVTSNV